MTWKPIETAPVGQENGIAALIAYEDGSVMYDDLFCVDEARPYEFLEQQMIDEAREYTGSEIRVISGRKAGAYMRAKFLEWMRNNEKR